MWCIRESSCGVVLWYRVGSCVWSLVIGSLVPVVVVSGYWCSLVFGALVPVVVLCVHVLFSSLVLLSQATVVLCVRYSHCVPYRGFAMEV